ncbi:MAG: DUF1877 family protein [Deltaproteobacteria bacterium]|nr:DUF1877 family protein [Deltaproteobacteria bacterium]
MTTLVAFYIRVPTSEIERLREHPEILPKYDPRVALGDGRGLDLGRAWEALGCLLDGGVRAPEIGPTVGEEPLPGTDTRAVWSYVSAARVEEIARRLGELDRQQFREIYDVDPEDTADSLPDERTAGWGGRSDYLYKKLRLLAKHYREAAEQGEAILVRIGERV